MVACQHRAVPANGLLNYKGTYRGLTVYIEDDIFKLLHDLALLESTSVAHQIRKYIRAGLDK